MKHPRPGAECPIDLEPVAKLLKKEGINYRLNPHPAFIAESKAKEILGYYPAGEWQITFFDKDFNKYSIIRGFVTFGQYEIMSISKKGKYPDPERFETAEELVEDLLREKIKS